MLVGLVGDSQDRGCVAGEIRRNRCWLGNIGQPDDQIGRLGAIICAADAFSFDLGGGGADAGCISDDDRQAGQVEVDFDGISGGASFVGYNCGIATGKRV